MLNENLATSLGRLLGYLRTWQNPDGLFGGTIATWWSSTLETAVPHPMNQYPLILGFLEMNRKSINGGNWLGEAQKIADGLISTFQPDGTLRNAWGDIPGKRSGPVLHAPGITALAELYRDTGEGQYLEGAFRLERLIREQWTQGPNLYHRVANQQFKWAEALLALFQATGVHYYVEQAKIVATEALDHRVSIGQRIGGVCQGRMDDRLITVYVAKCLNPLLTLYEITRQAKWIEAARMVGEYLHEAEVAEGIWSNYYDPDGLCYRLMKRTAGIDWRLQYRIPFHRFRRRLIESWRRIDYPSFIARSGDGISALQRLAKLDDRFAGMADTLLQKMVKFQMSHGGIRNTVGYNGKKQILFFQDVFCPTRWNAYAFYALCVALAKGQTLSIQNGQGFSLDIHCGNETEHIFHEENGLIELYALGRLVARIEKPSGRCLYIDEAWRGELTGPRAF